MKNYKKLFMAGALATTLTAAPMMSMFASMPVMAVEQTVSGNDTKTDVSDHTYVAYQIFTGTVANGQLNVGDIEWGNGINHSSEDGLLSENGLTALNNAIHTDTSKGTIIITNSSTAKDVAAALSDTNAKAVAKVIYKYITDDPSYNNIKVGVNTDVTPGYYLIVDTTKPAEGSVDSLVNLALLQVANGNIKIEQKIDKTPSDKEITNGDAGNTNDGTTKRVGDSVDFKITTEVPDMSDFDTYHFVIKDTMSTGLKGDRGSVVVKVNRKEVTATVTWTDDRNFTVQIPNMKTLQDANNDDYAAGNPITVEYSAVLTDLALQTGVETNTLTIEYSNNPQEEDSYTTTPPSINYVYDFTIDTLKVDLVNNNTKLSGAKFVLMNDEDKYYAWNETDKKVEWKDDLSDATIGTTEVDGSLDIAFEGLNKGIYKLKETQAPDGYNTPKGDAGIWNIVITPTFNAQTGKLVSYSVKLGNNAEETVTVGDNPTKETLTYAPKIENGKGSTLPETGGMGTTLLYTAGGVLVLGSLVGFITSKKMKSE